MADGRAGALRPYVCRVCGATIEPDASVWRCPCGGLLRLAPAAAALAPAPAFPRDAIQSRPWTLWRYAEALPFADGAAGPARVTLGEGGTPLVPISLGGFDLTAKLEFASPTLSFKDRGAVVLMALALELGATAVVCDSSGNAGTAVAAYAARAELPCTVFVPAATSPGKLAQIRAHGADVRAVEGSREDVAAAAVAYVDSADAFYASHVYNPYFWEGTKTYAFELWEQLGGMTPDTVVLPVGNGTFVIGAHIGFEELRQAGMISSVPRIVAVQAEGCAPIAAAFAAGAPAADPVRNEGTAAEGIAIAAPARSAEILEAVRATGGKVITVPESALGPTRVELARQGLYVEPTATVAPAAASMLLAAGDDLGHVVVPLCGAGLKAPYE